MSCLTVWLVSDAVPMTLDTHQNKSMSVPCSTLDKKCLLEHMICLCKRVGGCASPILPLSRRPRA